MLLMTAPPCLPVAPVTRIAFSAFTRVLYLLFIHPAGVKNPAGKVGFWTSYLCINATSILQAQKLTFLPSATTPLVELCDILIGHWHISNCETPSGVIQVQPRNPTI